MKAIDTYLFSGFLDSGKTTYIQDNLFHDYFYRYGTTLLLLFEDGEVPFQLDALKERKVTVSIYDGSESIVSFLLHQLEQVQPDRLYIECNAMMEDLESSLPDCLTIRAKTALINGETLDLFFNNMKTHFSRILTRADLVIFNRTKEKDTLLPYSTPFRLINPTASYLWESPLGYHEQAFGIPLTYDKTASCLKIKEEDYSCFYLDSLTQPEDYSGKTIELVLRITQLPDDDTPYWFGSRRVFTCCMADIQELGFYLSFPEGSKIERYSWHVIQASLSVLRIHYQNRLLLKVNHMEACAPPDQELIGYPVPSRR
ncbi:MAG: hypothetical protein IJ225_05050 [Solobacterium sp.]|nr:hypothetical protein [Solobacterium sp.]